MSPWFHRCFVLGVVVLMMSACGNSGTTAAKNNVPESLQVIAARLSCALSSQGYEIKQGYFYLYTLERSKYSARVMGTAYGNNPVSPYVLAAVPPWGEEFVDTATQYAMGLLDAGYNCTGRMDPREADVILALLPPQGAYFSVQSYLFTREGTINKSDPMYQKLERISEATRDAFFNYSPNPTRLNIAASIGNSVSNVNIENQSGASFGQERFLIITPDQFMKRKITAALLEAGVTDARDIFTIPLSPSLRVGVGKSADDFGTVIRYALPEDEAAANVWKSDLPLLFLRIRDKNATRSPEPFPEVVLDQKGFNPEAGLKGDLDNLVEAVKASWGQGGASKKEFIDLETETSFDLIGPHCIGRGMNCLADIQDTSYHMSGGKGIDNNELYAVVGTLGTETGNATYVSLGMYQASVALGVASVTQSEMKGTAGAFSGVVGDTNKFFVYYVTRDCGNLAACTSITTEMVPKGDMLNISLREYVFPGSARSPDPSQLLSPILITLDGSNIP